MILILILTRTVTTAMVVIIVMIMASVTITMTITITVSVTITLTVTITMTIMITVAVTMTITITVTLKVTITITITMTMIVTMMIMAIMMMMVMMRITMIMMLMAMKLKMIMMLVIAMVMAIVVIILSFNEDTKTSDNFDRWINELGCLNFLGTHTAAVVEFKIKRRLQHFIVGFYVPCIACTVASWIQFWMDEMAVGDRASLGITSVLTEIFLLEFSNQGMPKVSYMKVAELYLIVSFVFIFLALIESAVVYKVSQWSLLKKNSGKMTEKQAIRDKVIICPSVDPGSAGFGLPLGSVGLELIHILVVHFLIRTHSLLSFARLSHHHPLKYFVI